MILCLDLAQTWVVRVILGIKNIGILFIKKNDQFGIKHHQSVQFGAFQRFRDAMLGSSSNLGCKGYARYKKHWDTTYVQNMLFAAFYLDSWKNYKSSGKIF